MPTDNTRDVNIIKKIKILPLNLCGAWFTTENMHEIVNKGGLSNILNEAIIKCFQYFRDDTFVYKNRHN